MVIRAGPNRPKKVLATRFTFLRETGSKPHRFGVRHMRLTAWIFGGPRKNGVPRDDRF
jgi:hypothetical protein